MSRELVMSTYYEKRANRRSKKRYKSQIALKMLGYPGSLSS